MTDEEIIADYEPFHSQQEEFYTRDQVMEMLQKSRLIDAEEWLKSELANEEFKKKYTQNLVLQLIYCLPLPHVDSSFEEFTNHSKWNRNVAIDTANRLVRLLATGDANKII